MHFQLAAARISFVALVLGAVMALAAVAGVRLGLYPYAFGFKMMYPAVALGFVAFGAGAVFCYSAFQRNEGEGRRLGLAGFFGALLLLYPPVSTQLRGLAAPPIHDATTDPADPPLFVTLAKARKPGMNSLASNAEQPIHYHGQDTTVAIALHDYYQDFVKPHAGLLTSPAKAFWRSHQIVRDLGWTIVDADRKALRIEATDTSFWFGRVSDIVIRIRPANSDHGSRVDARSASREGEVDYGANLARLKAFFSRLKL